ncbi:MAG: polysaccharide deacetylase family protein [Firmicutes bacterium]|nr:polysaccharide deacetylase family protein [Bacillota bacterium]
MNKSKVIWISCIFCLVLIPAIALFGNQALRCMYSEKLTYEPFDADETPSTAYLPVLVYHHFQEESPTDNSLYVSKDSFDDQMRALKENGYSAVTAQQLIDFVKMGIPLPENPILITMDDGYTSNLNIAAPILEAYDMQAIIFVIGISAGEEKDPVSGNVFYYPRFAWAEALPWLEKGVLDIQCHSYDMHRKAADGYSIRDGMLRAEGESAEAYSEALKQDFDIYRSILKREYGTEMCALAFPFGYHSEELIAESKKNGIKLTFTTKVDGNYVTVGKPDSLHRMNRINVYDTTTGDNLIWFIEHYDTK